jgi:hypothetical protein
MLYKGSAYSDLVLKKGVALVIKHPEFVSMESKSRIIVSHAFSNVPHRGVFHGGMRTKGDRLGIIFPPNDSSKVP